GVRGTRLLRRAWPPFPITALVFLYRWTVLQGIGGYDLPGTGAPLFYAVHPLQTAKALIRLPALFFFPINWSRQPEWWLIVTMIAAIAAFVTVSRRSNFAFALG